MNIHQGFITFFVLGSTMFFPWIFTSVATLFIALREPLLPLAIGIIFDALYYAPHAHQFPVYTFYGFACTAVAFFVHKRLRSSTIR